MSRKYLTFYFKYLLIAGCPLAFTGSSIIFAQDWSTPIPIAEETHGYHPFILADGEYVHVVFPNDIGWSKICYLRSTNGGDSWDNRRVISDTTEDAGDAFPRILKNGSRLMILWKAYLTSNRNSANIGYSISNDRGVTWSHPDYVFERNWYTFYQFNPSNSGQRIDITISLGLDGENLYIYNVRSTDFGGHWSTPVVLYHPRIVTGVSEQVSFANYVHFVWSGTFNVDSLVNLNYARSDDYGQTWSENYDINEGEGWFQKPAISVDQQGNIAIIWEDPRGVLFRKSTNSGETWDPITLISDNNYYDGNNDIVIEENKILAAWCVNYWDIRFTKSFDNGQHWDEEYWIDRDTCESRDLSLASSGKNIYIIWYNEWNLGLDNALYFSRWPAHWVDIKDENELPLTINIKAYPNPFNSAATIDYQLDAGTNVTIDIYDALGQRVTNLVENYQLPGNYKTVWKADDLPSGIYFFKLQAGDNTETKKMTLVK